MITKLAGLQAVLRAWVVARVSLDSKGASLVEYALLLALIAVVAIGALVVLGGHVNNVLNNVAGNIK